MNNKNNDMLDEMQQKVVGDAGVICTVVTFIYVLIECVYKYIKTKDILSCSWELGLLLIISVIFYLFVGRIKEMSVPKTVLGRTLPTDKSKESRRKRIRAYLLDALLFSVALSVITLVFSKMGIDIVSGKDILIEAVGLFIVAIVINFFFGEYSCNKYEKWIKSLEDEDIDQ